MTTLKDYLDNLTEEYTKLLHAVKTTSKPGHECDFEATHNQFVVLKENCFLLISAVKDLHDHDGPISEKGQNELLLMVDEFFELTKEAFQTSH